MVNSSGIVTSFTTFGSPSSNSFVLIVLIIDVFPQFSKHQQNDGTGHTISQENSMHSVFHVGRIRKNISEISNPKTNRAENKLNDHYILMGKPSSVIHFLLSSFVMDRRYSFSLKWRLYLWNLNPIFSNILIEGMFVLVIFTKNSFSLR